MDDGIHLEGVDGQVEQDKYGRHDQQHFSGPDVAFGAFLTAHTATQQAHHNVLSGDAVGFGVERPVGGVSFDGARFQVGKHCGPGLAAPSAAAMTAAVEAFLRSVYSDGDGRVEGDDDDHGNDEGHGNVNVHEDVEDPLVLGVVATHVRAAHLDHPVHPGGEGVRQEGHQNQRGQDDLGGLETQDALPV